MFSSWFFSDTDKCYPNPCVNNGTCIDEVNNYTCACAAGFEGRNCTNSKWFKFMGILISMLFRSGENIKFCFKLQRRTIKSVFGLGIASSIFLAGSSFKREKKERKIDFSFPDHRPKLSWSMRFLEFSPHGFNSRNIKVLWKCCNVEYCISNNGRTCQGIKADSIV